MVKRAVIYARYSCSRQTEQSIEGQIDRCQDYATRNEFEIVNRYIDRATTGTNDNRPAFQQMMHDSKSKNFQFIIVYAVDRFARNPYDYYSDKKILLDNGVNLLSATEPLGINADGTLNLSGILSESIHSGYAYYYSKELSQKILRGREESMKKGTYLGGTLMFGYKVIDKKLYPNEEEVDIVRLIFRMYHEHYTISDIIKETANRGYHFKKTRLLAMLRNEKYIGHTIFNGKVYDNMYPAIIDKNIFYDIQDYFKMKKHSSSKLSDGDLYILSSKMYCGYCGSPMYGESGNKKGVKYTYYKCYKKKTTKDCPSHTVRKDVIERIVVNAVLDHLLTPANVDMIVAEILEEQKEKLKHSDVANLEKALKSVNRKIENIIKAIEQGVFSKSMSANLQALEEEQEALALKLDIAKSQLITISETDARIWLDHFAHTDVKDVKACQYLIEYFVKRVELYNDRVVIICNHKHNNIENSELTTRESSELHALVVGNVPLPRFVINRDICAVVVSI